MTAPDAPPQVGADEFATTTTGRLEAFSDGVLAVAATLLVLDLKTPEAGEDGSIWLFLGHQVPTLAAYVTSFLTILIYWVNHHTLFHAVKRVDRPSLFINGLMLLAISFISYATSVLGHAVQSGQHDNQAAVLYALTLAAASTCFTFLWSHLGKHPELLLPGSRAGTAQALRRSRVGPLLYLAAGAVALLSASASLAVDATIALYFAVLPHRRHRKADRPAEADG
nr:TMEM175 family protein [Streptomyces sp. NBC_00886]